MSDKEKSGRREFLKVASLGTVAGAALVATGQQDAEAAEADTRPGRGYRETRHVKTVYELSRF